MIHVIWLKGCYTTLQVTTITQADIETLTRDYLGEPDVNGRFTTAMINRLMKVAHNEVAKAVDWPEAIWTQTAVDKQQEYGMPGDLLKLWDVFVAGMLVVPSMRPTLQGTGLEFYDNTGGPNPATFAPAWQQQPASTYPPTGSQSPSVFQIQEVGTYPIPQVPWRNGLRPRYYFRGGFIGFVPNISGTPLITMTGVPTPPVLSTGTDVSIFPDHFLEGLCWKIVQIAKFSDEKLDQAEFAEKQFRTLYLPGMIKWVMDLAPLVRRPTVLTYRQAFYGGPNRGIN